MRCSLRLCLRSKTWGEELAVGVLVAWFWCFGSVRFVALCFRLGVRLCLVLLCLSAHGEKSGVNGKARAFHKTRGVHMQYVWTVTHSCDLCASWSKISIALKITTAAQHQSFRFPIALRADMASNGCH